MAEKTVLMEQTTRVVRQQRKAELTEAYKALLNKYEGGYKCLFWLSLLSTINSIIVVCGFDHGYFVDFGYFTVTAWSATSVGDAVAASSSLLAPIVTLITAFSLNLVFGLSFVLCGYMSRLNNIKAYKLGFGFYAVDGILLLFMHYYSIPSLIVHAYFLYRLYKGAKAYEGLEEQPTLLAVSLKNRKERLSK